MKIGAFLHQNKQTLVTCGPEETALGAAEKLRDNDIGAMPVLCAQNKLIGMISERDLIEHFCAHGGDLVNLKVRDMLSKSVIFMGPNGELSDAMRTMNTHGFRHVPIVSQGKVVGVVSMRDTVADAVSMQDSENFVPSVAVTSA